VSATAAPLCRDSMAGTITWDEAEHARSSRSRRAHFGLVGHKKVEVRSVRLALICGVMQTHADAYAVANSARTCRIFPP